VKYWTERFWRRSSRAQSSLAVHFWHGPWFAMRSADDASQADRDVPIEAFLSLGALTAEKVS